jgi:fumarate hydratase class II
MLGVIPSRPEEPVEESIVAMLERLRSAGFSAELRLTDGGVHVAATGQTYQAAQFTVVGVQRVEGISDPDDMAAVYAVEGPDGVRGVLVDAFGSYADPVVGAALAQMRPHGLAASDARAVEGQRVERDSLGEVAVPADRHWGAQTQRALEHFAIGAQPMPRALIHALGLVKRAVAEVNRELGDLPPEVADAIAQAAQEVANGALDDHFPLGVWQTGSGTQTNMNANEVIANRASELLGGERGARRRVHPNDDVNRSQSSNDVFPTAMQVAAAREIEERLRPALGHLRSALAAKSREFEGLLKMGRTHLMDAVPLTLGQEISGWVAQLDECRARVERGSAELLPLALGGSAVGTGLGTRPEFAERACARVAALAGLPFRSHSNKFAALAAHDAVVSASGALRTLAVALLKIANDVRWLASGPRGEITLPENEPGSSIMPGKVNPTQCEALAMVCVQVIGLDTAIAIAGSQGNFELNVYKPLLAYDLLTSIELLADTCRSFTDYCVIGIAANPERLRAYVDSSLMLVTALAPRIGYDAAARVAQKAHAEGLSLRAAALALGAVSGAEYDALVRPEEMLGPRAKKT